MTVKLSKQIVILTNLLIMQDFQFVREFQLHSNYLRHFALQLTKDHNQAEDLFQDTALKAFRYQDKFTPNTNLKAWLGTIMKNAFINLYRKRRKRSEVQDTTKESYYLSRPLTITENDGEMSVTMKELFGIINDLEDDYRIPFLMTYQGYKYEEIQKAMGDLPMGTIKSRIFHARKMLKSKITRVYDQAVA